MEEDKKIVPAEQIATGALNEYWDFIIKDIKNKSRLSGSKAKIKAYSDVIDTIQKHRSNWNISYNQLISGQPSNFRKAEEIKSVNECDTNLEFVPIDRKQQ